MTSTRKIPTCGKCGATGVKIYRPYAGVRNEETDVCNECMNQTKENWMCPCILDENGDAWGYNVPEKNFEAFYALPEKSNSHPHWCRRGGWSDPELSRLLEKNDQQNTGE